MPTVRSTRRLIVNADDFGRSASINAAVIRAHREGILTTASLMVNEPSCADAVALARDNPRLGVGLHLTFLCGRSALPPKQIPGLVNGAGEFTNFPAGAGFRYFFHRSLREQLRAEIHAQFARFRATGLPLDHVNGHLHLHLHPTIFRILMEDAEQLGIQRVRLTFDPFWLNLRLSFRRGEPGERQSVNGSPNAPTLHAPRSARSTLRTLPYCLSHAIIFHTLAARARPVLRRRGFRHTHYVFGLLQNAHVDEDYLLRLLPNLPPGDSELYSHPSLDEFKNEFDALISPRVRALAGQLGLQLIRYQDL